MNRAFVLLLGFGCAFPIGLSATTASIRLSDVSMVIAAIGALAIIPKANFTSPLVRIYTLIAALTTGWIWAELQYGDALSHDSSAMILLRWIVAIPASYFLCILARDIGRRKALFIGIILGLFADTLLLGYDYICFQITGKPAFLASPHIWYVNDVFRASGVEGDPNAASIAANFLVPFLLGAASEFQWKWWPAGLATAVLIFVFVATQSRGAFVPGLCVLLIWAWTTQPRRLVQLCSAAVVVVGFTYVILPEFVQSATEGAAIQGLLTRFTDSESISWNADLRGTTMLKSFELALENPLGMGSSYAPALAASTGYNGATHNGFIQLAVLGGLPLTCVVVIGLFISGSRIFRRERRTENWVAAYILGTSLFEAVLFGPYISLLILWVLGSVAGSSGKLVAPLQSRRAGLPYRRPLNRVEMKGTLDGGAIEIHDGGS